MLVFCQSRHHNLHGIVRLTYQVVFQVMFIGLNRTNRFGSRSGQNDTLAFSCIIRKMMKKCELGFHSSWRQIPKKIYVFCQPYLVSVDIFFCFPHLCPCPCLFLYPSSCSPCCGRHVPSQIGQEEGKQRISLCVVSIWTKQKLGRPFLLIIQREKMRVNRRQVVSERSLYIQHRRENPSCER